MNATPQAAELATPSRAHLEVINTLQYFFIFYPDVMSRVSRSALPTTRFGIEFHDHCSQPQSQSESQSQVPVPVLGPSIQQNHKTETKRRQLRCCGDCAPRALHAKRQFRYKMSKCGRLKPTKRV